MVIFSDGDLTMSGNDIYRQVGVSFYLDSVIVTNIPAAYNLLYDTTTNGVWDFDRLVGVGHDTSGIECYFVNRFIRTNGKRSPVAANTDHGMVLTAKAGVTTLAHEIGHAFGLKDVYVSSEEKDDEALDVKDVSSCAICSEKATDDWNGGCDGSGDPGARYYQHGTKMSAIIPRLVMYGIVDEVDTRRDITRGNVDGVWYSGEDAARVWFDTNAGVGFFVNQYRKESPCHN